MPSSKGLFHSIRRLTINEQFTPSMHTLERQYRGKSAIQDSIPEGPFAGHVQATIGLWEVLVVGSILTICDDRFDQTRQHALGFSFSD